MPNGIPAVALLLESFVSQIPQRDFSLFPAVLCFEATGLCSGPGLCPIKAQLCVPQKCDYSVSVVYKGDLLSSVSVF